jgi:hypothetical protein
MIRLWADTSAASLAAAGVLGTLVCNTTGPYIAMALAIYGGNTEPSLPSLSFPWVVFAAALVLGVGGRVMVSREVQPGRQRMWSGLVLGAAVALAVLPIVHLARLVSATGS